MQRAQLSYRRKNLILYLYEHFTYYYCTSIRSICYYRNFNLALQRCPSDKILVIYGKTGGTSAKCIHGGGALIWPVIQDFQYLDLKPISIEANLTNALSRQKHSC